MAQLPRHGRTWASALLAAVTSAAMLMFGGVSPAAGSSASEGGDPVLEPADGAFLEGTAVIAAAPTVADDSVTSLAVDGDELVAEATVGVSHLRFDVGTNSTEARYQNYIVINGEHRIDIPDLVNERASLEVPNEHLRAGENVVEIVAGTINASCGLNHDDFVLANISLDLLGEVANGEENEYAYAFGDGSCGSNTSLLLRAELSFVINDDPRRTTGLGTDLDTTSLANGEHQITATTESGAIVTHTVTVNNAPAGAPTVSPTDGTLVNGTQPVFATRPADGEGGVASMTIDGAEPPTAVTLGQGAATFSFDVGSNSIDDRFDNYLMVNGKRIDMGGNWVSERVELAVPAQFLVPGENIITVVTGDRNESCGANRDDFAISNLALTFEDAVVTGHDIAPSYVMGDGACGSSTTARPEVELRWTVDAPGVHARPTLGSGNASFAFDVATNSIEARYHSYLLVNGMKLDIGGDYRSERVDVTIPNEWLMPGWNTVDFVSGTFATSCGDNRDDYVISSIELTPAHGAATGQMVKPSYSMGDGSCGSNINLLTEIDLQFLVDAPARGVRADVDTAQLDDGEHAVAATATTGEAATRVLVTDNTGPVVAHSTPTEGTQITSSAPLDLEVEDPSGVLDGWTVALDGASIQLGELVGPGLSAGEHVVAVTATDSLGNTATREVGFTSAGIPDAPTDVTPESGADGVEGSVTLGARIAEPDGGPVAATFAEAEILTPNQGWQGTAPAVPTTLRVPGERNVGDTRSLAPGDGETLDAPASGDVTFQRFDVQIRGQVAEPVLRWAGVIDPARLATLRVWNLKTRTWDAVASARGAAEGQTVLTATVDQSYIDRQQVHVMVTGEDPFADDIDPGPAERFEDPADYDFSIVHFTDTQYLSEGAVEQETAQERAVWEQAYGDVTRWIRDNAENRKIAYAAHTGDIIENNTRVPSTPELEQQVIGEFEVASRLQGILDDAGIPNQVIAGNHDNRAGLEIGPEALFNEYFGPDRYAAADDQWEHAEYGGPWRDGDNQNNYLLFSAGGVEFVAVGLSYGVTREEADWADSIFKRFSDRNAILLTHDYLQPSTNPDGRGATLAGPDGSMLYNLLVVENPNVFLVLAGHRHGVGTNVRPEVGQVGNGVVELLADYQFYTVSADRLGLTEVGGYNPNDQLRFGASFLRMLQFDVDRAEMHIDTYSPFLDDFGATEFDTEQRFNGLEDNMVLPADLTSRTTSFQTDSVALYAPIRVIGEATVASGEVATVTWDGLRPRTTYAWTVIARSAGGGVTSSQPSVFVTRGRTDRGS